MSKLTPIEIKRQLQDRLNTLHSEAIANRQNFQLGKASGIGSLIFGGIGCAAFPPLGIPAAVVAGGLWLASVFAETTTTGRIMPLPWVGVRLLDLAAGMDRMATTAGMEADEVELTDYLSPELRTEYLLIRFQGEQLSTALSQLDEYEVETGFATIVARAMKVFGGGGMRLNEATEESAEFVYDASTSLSLSLPQIAPQISPQVQVMPEYQPAQIGSATRFGSVDVESQSIPAIAELTVGEFIDTTPQGRDAETAIKQAQSGDRPRSAMKLTDLSLSQRALTIKAKLEESGFQLGSILSKSVTVIAGEQRGGKGTLLAMLGILMKAFNPELKVLYFTAGSDLYPVGFDKVICADSFPGDKNPDKRVFDELYSTVMSLKKYEHYEAKNFFIVVDEAIALGDSADPAKNQEMAKYLLTRFSKSGAGAAVVLHASNLSSWLGQGNTGGLAQTFKNSANFIGCGTQSIPDVTNPMRQIQIASGEYFLADPDNFGKRAAGKNSDLGKVPDFLLTRKNPHNGSPDPVRSLLSHFPELVNQNPVTVIKSSSNSKVNTSSLEDMDAEFWGLDEPAKSDPWQSEQAIPILTTDQKFQCLTNALATMPSLSVASIGSSLGLDRVEAFQLAVVYAFRHKKTTIYDPETQTLISKVKQ